MLLMIDNYDSFTYNLVQYFSELGVVVRVVRNDELPVDKLWDFNPKWLVISPGPCTPTEAGISVATIQAYAGRIPILGVCLGHQAIGQAFGGQIVHARQVMHGKLSAIHHHSTGVFTDLPSPFQATRYHSLVINQTNIPECLEVTGWTCLPTGERDEIMAVRHRSLAIQGVQFHPESILTDHGHKLLSNFLENC